MFFHEIPGKPEFGMTAQQHKQPDEPQNGDDDQSPDGIYNLVSREDRNGNKSQLNREGYGAISQDVVGFIIQQVDVFDQESRIADKDIGKQQVDEGNIPADPENRKITPQAQSEKQGKKAEESD